ncbi:Uncharacterised protein [Mycobacteroides abscessus subsp. abscessus]|nr:Uncharacterised protein [Mycobacteroides abscessus subsp. abscessus]
MMKMRFVLPTILLILVQAQVYMVDILLPKVLMQN